MDAVHALFLEALGAALENKSVGWDDELSQETWGRLMTLAEAHRVLPLIYEAVYSCPAAGRAEPGLFAPWRQKTIQSVMLQTLKTRQFLELLSHMTAGGVTPLVVKGLICRELYPKPDHRMSGDEDVLIPPEQLALCRKILGELGMEPLVPEGEIPGASEVPFGKPGSPLYLELHMELFPADSEAYGELNRCFDGIRQRAITETVQGIEVPTLGHTDHLLYLILHAFKHFLHSGFGIRQVSDICLYANAYGAEIDWKRLGEQCGQIHADRFAAALFRIGETYLTFDPDRACLPESWRTLEVDEGPLLEDILDSGIYGGDTMSRRHSSNITLHAVSAEKQGKRGGNHVLKTVFPSAKNLWGRYPYLKKKPWLLPVAWADRILKYGKEASGGGDNRAADSVKIGKERIRLMGQYGILTDKPKKP